MRQPSPGKNVKKSVKISSGDSKCRYGTSNLEEYFMYEFLDKLGCEYVYQKQFSSLKRVFDFYIPSARCCIEIDGDYWHSNPDKYDQKKLSPMQKKNKRVDEQKNKWAAINNYLLIRIWEKDIHENSEKVMSVLRKEVGDAEKKQMILESERSARFFAANPHAVV